jgi:hypothetical protein
MNEDAWRYAKFVARRDAPTNPEPDYDALDPGIRETVRWLRRLGWETTDSGDGVSKESDALWCPWPHVHVQIDGHEILAACGRMMNDLLAAGIEVAPCGNPEKEPSLEVTYDPVDGIAILTVTNLNDERF